MLRSFAKHMVIIYQSRICFAKIPVRICSHGQYLRNAVSGYDFHACGYAFFILLLPIKYASLAYLEI